MHDAKYLQRCAIWVHFQKIHISKYNFETYALKNIRNSEVMGKKLSHLKHPTRFNLNKKKTYVKRFHVWLAKHFLETTLFSQSPQVNCSLPEMIFLHFTVLLGFLVRTFFNRVFFVAQILNSTGKLAMRYDKGKLKYFFTNLCWAFPLHLITKVKCHTKIQIQIWMKMQIKCRCKYRLTFRNTYNYNSKNFWHPNCKSITWLLTIPK